LALATALLLLALVAPAQAAAPRTTLPDVEDEVMCTQCGTPLNISEAAVADRERRFIQALIDQGRTKAQIKAALEEEYGPRVLAVPSRGGFDDAAYAVPIALAVLALLGVGIAARRWRRARGPDDEDPAARPAGPELDPRDASRLDSELAAFDR
jgi:cytochrome c-type biogenesis protein CcmH/NrfF